MNATVQSIIETAPPTPPETIQATIARLSALASLDYELVREAEAKRLNIRVSALDAEVLGNRETETNKAVLLFPSVKPWSEPVDGAALLHELAALVKRFIICEPETALATALWIAFSWSVDFVDVAPLAVITAPEKRCGKSQLLNLIARLSRRPLVASNISPAAVFRVIEAHCPTLLIDEADAFMRDNEEMRGLLNSGHTRQSAFVVRTVGDEHEPKIFSTWGAKAVSGIGHLPETLMDRAVILELRRKLPSEKVDRLRHAEKGLFSRLSSMLARWAEDNGAAIERSRPALPEALNDRAQDNWEPLLAIADCAGGEWPKLARDAALKISGSENEAASLSAELLADIKTVFEKLKVDHLASVDLLAELVKDEEAPWATYNRGKQMSPRQLAKRLGEYGIKPKNIRIGRCSVPREWAEGFATLDRTPCPSAYTPERWHQLVNDGGLFLDRWGRQAAGLGWRAVDVFGVNPDAPESRYDGAGLVPLLCGRRVCTIKDNAAGIDCGGGRFLTFYRQNLSPASVALWKLGG